jgi:glycosyltransferase involved in cell wall biosynthesis
MLYNRKIDVIIPAYNVPDETLFKCLSSIACQTISKDLKITVVDDASTTQNYKRIAKFFKPFLDIQVLRYEINGGPGVARQYGIDNTENEYITFIDADDTLNGAYALHILRQQLETKEQHVICVGVFDETRGESDKEELMFSSKEKDLIWMFGKLYKREHLEKFNIRFHPTSRANEDAGFNGLAFIYTQGEEQILYLAEKVYHWHENLNSITREEHGKYSYSTEINGGFYGLVENLIYVVTTAQNNRSTVDAEKLFYVATKGLANLYFYYMDCCKYSPENAEKGLELCKKYYKEGFSLIENEIPEDYISYCVHEVLKEAYVTDEISFIPQLTFNTFFETIKQ